MLAKVRNMRLEKRIVVTKFIENTTIITITKIAYPAKASVSSNWKPLCRRAVSYRM